SAHAGGRKSHLDAAEPELLEAHDGPVKLADQARPDRRFDGGLEEREPMLLTEWGREDDTQARGAGIEQQPGGDRPAPWDSDRRAEQREIRVRSESHYRAV